MTELTSRTQLPIQSTIIGLGLEMSSVKNAEQILVYHSS